MARQLTWYDVLDVPPGASAYEVQRAFEVKERLLRPALRHVARVAGDTGWRKHHPRRVIPGGARAGLLMAHTPALVRPADGAAWTTTT